MIVDGHGCHTALHFGVKAKENQEKVPTLYWLPKLHKKPIKQDLLLILVLVRQQNFLNCYPCVLEVLTLLSSIVETYMRDPVKTYFGLLKIQVKFLINLKLEISMRPVCLLMIFLLFTLLYLII